MTITLPIFAFSLFEEQLQEGRQWCAHSFSIVLREDSFKVTRRVTARDRQHAVYQAVQYYWSRFDGVLGHAWQVLTVDDPHHEVVYTPDFCCPARKNNYLPQDVKARVIAESNGVLVSGKVDGKAHHPPNSLRRTKRRRKLPFRVKPHVYTDANGTFFYSITTQSQISTSGSKTVTVVKKRKVQLIRLNARNIASAESEIRRRNLIGEHLRNSKRCTRTRYMHSSK